MSSREFNQHTSRAKAAAADGPLIITERGKPSYVLMSKADYERLRRKGKRASIAEALADPRPEADFAFQFPRATGLFRPVDFDDPE